jgi:hypothetical protein
VVLDVATPLFERAASVSSTNHGTYWVPSGGGLLYRAASGAAFTPELQNAEHLRLYAGATRKRYLRVEIRDGDDPPLDVRAASAEYAPEEIVLRTNGAGPHTLYFADPNTGAPSYDLAQVLARSGDVPLVEARFGPFGPSSRRTVVAPPPVAWSDRNKLLIGIVLALILAALAAWTIRLLKRSKREGAA